MTNIRSRRQMVGPSSAPSPESVIKILISTDNHLGYLEKDPVRGDDSFRAFEEVLQIAKANEVDMVLLAGDLFHDNKPSRSTLIKTMRLLRETCMSPGGSIRIAVRSDPSVVNYMNPTLAVSLPVFVIHGNHDDPTGATGLQALSALDILSEAGLVTYFGKVPNSKRIEVSPILLQKGRTALALYGIGNVRDEVLYQTWAKEHEVKWLSPMQNPADRARQRHLPDTDSGEEDDLRWFNLLVLHQNRVMRGTAKGISETLLPPWLDYVVWGHEHDSLPELTLTSPPVVQPGSTVATSLSAGEAKPKHAVLLEVYRGKLKHRPIPLHTVRTFRFHDIALSEQSESDVRETDPKTVVSFLEETVKEMTSELETEFDAKLASFQTGTFRDVFNGVCYPPAQYYIDKLVPLVRQPLIRLRVEISGNWDVPNPQRFGQGFLGRVASASEIILYYRSKRHLLKKTRTFMAGYSGTRGEEGMEGEFDENEDGMMLSQNGVETRDVVQIPKLVQYYLYHSKAGGTGLKFLELDRLTGAVDHFVNKMETKAITDYVQSYLKVQQSKTLEEVEKEENGLDENKLLEKFKGEANQAAKRVMKEAAEKVAEKAKNTKDASKDNDLSDMDGHSEEIEEDKGGKSDSNPQRSSPNVENDVEKALEDVHAALTAVPKLAQHIEQIKPADSDNENEEDDVEEIAPSRSRATAASRGRGRSRARGSSRGRGRARGIDSYLTRKESQAESARKMTPKTRPRRTTRRTESIMVDDSDDIDEIQPQTPRQEVSIGPSDEEEEEYVPAASSHKRRATRTNSSAGGRASQRRRTESVVAPASASASASVSRRSAFAGRARTRRNTATINVDEESGDDAM